MDDVTKKVWDLVIIGAGPAALSAAIYTSREDISTVLIEKGVIGGLAAITDKVDNYPGFEEGIVGFDLAEKLRKQAERFGAVIELDQVDGFSKKDGLFEIKTASGNYKSQSILIATGSEWKKLGIPNEDKFYGRGIHNCATCDGAFYRDKKLVIVGGGNSAAQEGLYLTKFASEIEILVRSDKWKASDVLIEEINQNPKIKVRFKTKPLSFEGDQKITGVKVQDESGEYIIDTDGVFVFVGLKPVTEALAGSGVEVDEFGFVKTNQQLETNVAGVFCAGDVRSGATMQIASAVGEGAAAALTIREFLNKK